VTEWNVRFESRTDDQVRDDRASLLKLGVSSILSFMRHNVIVLSWVSFFQDASEMLYPVLPLFLTSVLGAPPAIVGVIEGVAEGIASLLKGYAGWLADRLERRPLVVAG
jgi:hypothetical protein